MNTDDMNDAILKDLAIEELFNELATLRAEVERLREALTVIENTTYDVSAEKLAKEAMK